MHLWTCFMALSLLLSRVSRAIDVHDDPGVDSSLEGSDPSSVIPRPQRPLRPTLSISEKVIPIQLVDTSSGQVRPPKRKQLRLPALMAALGKDLDPAHMSVERPAVLVEGPDYPTQPSQAPRLTAALSALNLTQEVGPLSESKTEAWLLRKASCPMRFVWEDVGPLFWPRWVKRGDCVNDPRRSCSWPPGMHCVPAESVIVHLLRWHCRPRSRRSTQMPAALGGGGRHKGHHDRADNKNFRCQWLKVPYPVTDKCFCSC